MAEIINMPRLSDTMEEGVVAKWLKKVGDKVNEGDILAEIETDKATMEFESFHSGTLLYIGLQEGESAKVDTLLAIIGKEGEDISALIGGGAPAPAKAEAAAPAAAPTPAATGAAVPAGVEIVTMPRLSDTMTEGTVASWLKKVGDTVKEGDILAEIETDKATMEFESFYAGTLLYIGLKEGESASVDSLLAIIGPAGTDVNAVLAAVQGGGAAPAAPAAKAESKEAAPAAPAAAPAATNANDRVKGSGENGRIIRKDVENFTPSAKAAAPAPAAASAAIPTVIPVGVEVTEEVKNSQMRKTIAKRLSESKFTAPHYYLAIEIDMDNAMASRAQINSLPDTKISFNDMVVKACAMALKKHPQVNTSWKGDVTVYNKHVNVGVAVAIEDGLVVPVIKFTDTLTLTQIGTLVKDLAGKARNKKLTPAEMEGSTFTVSNLGMFGVDVFTSIINQPNSAILSVGAIIEKPVVKNGQIVVGHTMQVTLACDHRTIDGATGAQFLQTLKSYIENPVTMLA